MASDRAGRVLFVCVENSCRSQMADGFARALGVESHSAGSRPSGVVNARAVEFMRERGVDLSRHESKGIDAVAGMEFDAVVTMGCGDACPSVPARRRLDWAIPDPKHLTADEFRAVRDQIERQVRELVAALRGELPGS